MPVFEQRCLSVKLPRIRRSSSLLHNLIPVFIFSWPFVVLFPYALSVRGRYLAIGNDFIILYYSYKPYLLDRLSHLIFPLWSPSESAGFPFYSNPFTQAFYPLNLPLTIFYRLAKGYTILDHQRFTILGISIFALGLYYWLRSLKLSPRAVIFSALVISVSFKVVEILRFPNAVHTAAWYPWILFGFTRLMLASSIRKLVLYSLLLSFSLICFLTGGYPYYIYYGIFLFIPYAISFTIPALRNPLVAEQKISWKHVLPALLLVSLITLSIIGPYLYKIAWLLKQTVDRGGSNFYYSTAHEFTVSDTVGSLIFPPAAQTEGWYYFGILGVLLILLYLITVDNHPRSNWRVKVFFTVWFLLITYISYGKYSYLFIFLWKYLPGFSSLRVWGRMNIILVPILAWLLAIAYDYFEACLDSGVKARPLRVLIPGFIGIVLIQASFIRNQVYDYYWRNYVSKNMVTQLKLLQFEITAENLTVLLGRVFILLTIAACLILAGLLLLGAKGLLKSQVSKTMVLSGLVVFSLLNIQLGGPWAWAWRIQDVKDRNPINVARLDIQSFKIPRMDYSNTISLTSSFNTGILENWYFERYVKFYQLADREPNAKLELLGVQDGTRIFFSESINYPLIQEFIEDAEHFPNRVHVIDYNGDKLVVRVKAPTDGYLSFIDNWDPDWRAYVDGDPVSIELLFGTFKSVYLSEGNHRVIFEYKPSLWGYP